jgi:hypothetical protein
MVGLLNVTKKGGRKKRKEKEEGKRGREFLISLTLFLKGG